MRIQGIEIVLVKPECPVDMEDVKVVQAIADFACNSLTEQRTRIQERKIDLIKSVRIITGLGLKEAKDAVDLYQRILDSPTFLS